MKNFIQYNDLSIPVYNRLKAMIENGELLPGQKLLQEKLASDLGVSRTPLLKALQNLEHDMLVESKPRRGMYVKEISIQEMIDVYDCREAVESMAVKLLIDRADDNALQHLEAVFQPFINSTNISITAYRKADEVFHDMLIDLSENVVLKKMSLVSKIHKRVYQLGLLRPPEATLQEHIDIVNAILNRDHSGADKAIRNHIHLSRKQLVLKQDQKTHE